MMHSKSLDLTDCDVYIQITRGIATRKHLFPDAPVSISMTVRPMRVIEDSVRQAGMTAIFHEDERWKNCYIKSLNLLPNILAKQKAEDAGCYEAILVKDNFVTEGTSSNVYMVKDKVIYSTPLIKTNFIWNYKNSCGKNWRVNKGFHLLKNNLLLRNYYKLMRFSLQVRQMKLCRL